MLDPPEFFPTPCVGLVEIEHGSVEDPRADGVALFTDRVARVGISGVFEREVPGERCQRRGGAVGLTGDRRVK